MKKGIYLAILSFIIISLLTSCDPISPDPNPSNKPTVDSTAHGVYILNEGTWGMNNSSISYKNLQTGEIVEDIFLQANGRGLGDTGSDLQAYGSKLYCVVNTSERLEIMNLENCESIETIAMEGKQPRKLAFNNGRVYVSCFDGGVVCIDTATFQIVETIQAGSNPEGLCFANNKLYVANSGGMNYPHYDSTVSVFNASNHQFIKNIPVAINPTRLFTDHQNDVYLISMGNYSNVPVTLQRIDSNNDLMAATLDLPASNLTIEKNFAYMYSYDYASASAWVKIMDITSESVVKEQFITDGTAIKLPYGITVNQVNNNVYIADAIDNSVNGDVYCFDKDGKKLFQFEVGINPSSIVIVY